MSGVPGDKCKVPRAFWRAVEGIGLPPPAVLRQARLPAALHINEHAFVTTVQYFALWKALEELSTEPAPGIKLVQAADTAIHPPSTLAAFHARDYRDGIARVARFKRLCTPEQLNVAEANGECTISSEWLYATEPAPAIATDVAFAFLLELGRRGTGRHLTPRRVEFARADPKSDVHRDYFGCPVRYGAPRDLLVLRSADLDRPFPGHNPELLDILTPALAAALGELNAQSSTSEQVKVVLKRSLASGRPELSGVARELGMSERTLQRRITEDGTSFRELLVNARQELGRQLLSDPSADIDEVACLLGYQDASSFYRAFREWEGTTPNRWRELNFDGFKPAASGSFLQ
ncbi:AraC family transcriptional regulator [Mesorhizobium sp. M1C.F.Ca.ET.193.01.1.1]|uniref:AraC family transcriptional regulator n=1 Tax=unclassified Mesorhizobium TaxID=325217 RepID=UPI000FD42573|nr:MULTISPECIES: AraC family transcriptional regulator [unclassified Mesorhizobium]TGS92992.1 AraC family transcriptional regulator [bacterium M00.F.Ca.ET.177.01.1.1]TGQ50512.1 AraC family transcriptional regulator [Mesorhizobium sp. M1C.F.Ca.ET.210.01.1.1]TGQ65691.1 AraC family transcriptional regulator [Mesorhizobium sp. M1C.F.Ca.ET.212.01.1.1]TGQ99382.1 AraC family transcriptional regulator [Mesorhizobium sp. M1C.F.Ca.ET.204.01.1.1]TGR19685.1 AraC family transcriptional regulator [Mesorhizo